MGVTLAQFFTESETQQLFTKDEAELIKCYRKLPDEVKKSFSHLAKTCSVRYDS